ncbi:MAG: nuclear transport factor 2 family protein [Proteobacteria bacterium]|nr:nuclear transport factor 2 family protein [Pseudomonadota bacterium]
MSLHRLVVPLCAAALAGTALAAVPAAAPPGATATREVVEYTALENRLAAALAAGDRATIAALLEPDFVQFSPESAEPLDREAFLAAGRARRATLVVYRLAVLSRGDTDLVSFLLQRETPGPAVGRLAFCVDVWRRADHRLLARYRIEPRAGAPLPKAPSGRD